MTTLKNTPSVATGIKPTNCQATFKEHCTAPKCDCDRDDVPIVRHPKVIRRWHCSANYWDGQPHCESLRGHIQCVHCIKEEQYISEYKRK